MSNTHHSGGPASKNGFSAEFSMYQQFELICRGALFQRVGPATEIARSSPLFEFGPVNRKDHLIW